MRRKRMRLVSLILSAVCLLGCAVQPAPVSDSSESNTKVSAYAASQAEQNEEERTEAESLLPQTEDGGDTSESSVAPERAGASENADKAAEKQPTAVETAPPAAPKEPAIPAPAPESKPAPTPTPAPTPAEKQEEEPAPTPEPVPAPEPKPEPADRWAAVSAANAYAVTQYGVITDGSLTMDNSAYRFPASVAADASQEALEAKARDMVDYTFRQLMMQAGMDSIADAGFHCNVCIVEDGTSLLIYVLYDG